MSAAVVTLVDPDEPEWLVIVEYTIAYRVNAETPELAAMYAEEGIDLDHRTAENIDSTVELVTYGDGSWLDDDLRARR